MLMLFTSFIGNAILIFLIIIYNYVIIKPYRSLPVFIVRRPKFCFIFMICCSLSAMVQCTISFTIIIYPSWSSIWCRLLPRVSFYFGTFAFSVTRVWLLYYDINCVSKQQTRLLSKYFHLQPQHCKKNYDIRLLKMENINVNQFRQYQLQ